MGTRCCDNCEPRLFPVEKVSIKKAADRLRRGKKKALSNEDQEFIRNHLKDWHDTTLVREYYGQLTGLSGRTILGNDVINKLATCGEQLEDYSQVQQYARWAIGYDQNTKKPKKEGILLVSKLGEIYKKMEQREKDNEIAEYQKNTLKDFVNLTADDFQ